MRAGGNERPMLAPALSSPRMGPGDVVAERFAIEREAGAGGMGCVYQATDRQTGVVVALKVMLGLKHADRFAREAVALASLRDEAIVGYVDHGVTGDGTAWLAMEWLDGEDLADHLARGPLPVADARALVMRVACALDVAHRAGIVHRDIKPSNVFLPARSLARAKLVDFGIARMASGAQTLTRPGSVLGTPSYMAPEQARGAADVGPAADVFALGGLLYECLVGVPAFRGEHAMAVLAKILFEEAPRARAARPDVPLELDALIARMLAKSPAERPSDAGAVLAELARLDLESMLATPARSLPGALGGDEQRYVAALLVVGAVTTCGHAETIAESEALPMPALLDIVARHGGRAEVLADGTLAVLVAGTGGAATDQAARAARCALALRRVLPDEPMLLAMGRADLGATRSIGEVIDRAAELGRGARRGGAVRLDEVAAGLLEVGFEIHRGDAIELLREHEAIESTRTLLGRPTPCVGRERELVLLASYVDECLAEPCARAVVVTAAAGVGKSRLAHEAVRRLRQRNEPISIWITRADATRAGSPFGLLAPLIRQVAGTHEGESLALRHEKLRALLARSLEGDVLEHATVFLAELVGAPFPVGISRLLDDARPDAKRLNEHVRHAWCAWLAAECAAQPLAIVVEDLHWGDAPSASFLDSALRELRDLPFFVLALARPEVSERFPRLWAERGAQEVRLAALGKRPCEALVRDVLGARATAETVDRVVRQAAGNAFFLEELIRAVAEDRAESLPETVVAMAAARLERLSPEARLLLRAASVFGEVFWAGGVAALAGGLAAARVEELLPDLVAAEVIMRRGDGRFAGETEYAFRHALMREAARAMLTDEDRVLGHRLAGHWLEAAGETQAIVLAEHFDVGGEPALAHAWYVRAAAQALEANQFRSVLAHATRALELDAEPSATEIHELRGDAYFALGASADAVRELTAALERVPPSDRDQHVRIRLRIANASFLAFDLAMTLREHGEAALGLLGLDDRPALIAEAMAAVAVADQALGELEAAVRDYPRIKERAGGHYFANEAHLLSAFLWHGDHDELIARGSAYVEAARAQHDIQGMLLVQPAMGLALVGKGLYRDALRLFDEARAGAVRFGNNPMLARTNSMATSMYLEAFDFDEAARLAREARERALTFSFPATSASACIDLLLIAIRSGDMAAAEAQLVETSERVATLEGKGWHGWLFAMRLNQARAELALARGQAEVALDHAASTLAQASHHSRLKYLAIAETTRGRALIATGAHREGVDALRIALGRARRLGDPAVVLRSALALLPEDGDDALLADVRGVVAAMAAELPDTARSSLLASPAVAATLR